MKKAKNYVRTNEDMMTSYSNVPVNKEFSVEGASLTPGAFPIQRGIVKVIRCIFTSCIFTILMCNSNERNWRATDAMTLDDQFENLNRCFVTARNAVGRDSVCCVQKFTFLS